MADDVAVPEDLKARFVEMAGIASLTESVRKSIDRINEDNVDAGGKDDVTARTYHSQVDGPTKNLSSLVGDVAALFGLTADRGAAAADVLAKGENDASQEAGAWVPKPAS